MAKIYCLPTGSQELCGGREPGRNSQREDTEGTWPWFTQGHTTGGDPDRALTPTFNHLPESVRGSALYFRRGNI